MKKLKLILLFLLICPALSGCSNFRLDSVDDLISPVSPSGDDAAIISAVNDYCKNGYSIKIPLSGKYTTSFIRCDLSGNGNDEAVAFYEPSDRLGSVDMAVLNKSGGTWQVVGSVTGDGADVSSVDFADINNDGSDEIIVCWSMISGSSSSNLRVYNRIESGDKFSFEALGSPIKADQFICCDINNDSETELLVFTVGTPKAELYLFESGSEKLIGETKLDGRIISFSSISVGETDEGVSIYADAVCTSGASMVTELIYWSDYYDSVISPFYSYSTGRTTDTYRNNTIVSRDVDGDGEIEIPVEVDVSSLPDGITAQDWVSYENTVLNHKSYSFACEKDNYILTLNDDIFSEVSLAYSSDSRELVVKKGGSELFRILTVVKSSYNSGSYDGYIEIHGDSGFIYLAKITGGSKAAVTIDDLKNSIITY